MMAVGWQSEESRSAAHETLASKMASGIYPFWTTVKKIDEEKERLAMEGVKYD